MFIPVCGAGTDTIIFDGLAVDNGLFIVFGGKAGSWLYIDYSFYSSFCAGCVKQFKTFCFLFCCAAN